MIKIPLKLESEANSNEHWSKSYKRHRMQKKIIRAYLKKEYCSPLLSVMFEIPICVTLTKYAPREFDSDNLQSAFKYIRDAISEYVTGCTIAGRADNDTRISWDYKQEKTKNKEYYITIEISSTTKNTPTQQE